MNGLWPQPFFFNAKCSLYVIALVSEPSLQYIICGLYFFAMIYFLDLLPQLAAPTFLHFANAPLAYAEGKTLYLAFTFL